jgi:C1A family cysteine protease
MKAVIFLALVGVALCSAHLFSEQEYQFLFSKWVAQHSKKYNHENFFYRYTVFKHNMDKIVTHNKKGKSWTMAMNKFGDMTAEEFKSTMLGYNQIDRSFLTSKNRPAATHGHKAIPKAVDWRADGAVTHVKDQKQCGSCWAFSATGSMEGAHYLATKDLVSLSEQQLVDCSGPQGNSGCNGGLMDNAFQYVIANGGITTESKYAYTARNGACSSKAGTDGAKISSFSDVTPQSLIALDTAVAAGPVSVAIEADQEIFQYYSGGIINDDSCGTQLDHGVLAVGYNDAGGVPYYIVKNSWGANWGLNGYVYIGRTEDNTPGICGILSEPSFPVV